MVPRTNRPVENSWADTLPEERKEEYDKAKAVS